MIKQVIIFAGGKGERMMPLSSNKPKCLIKLSKKPFIEYLLEQIENLKVKEVIILVGYKSKKILEYLKLKKYNFKIITKHLDEKFETSKRILNIKKLLKKEFMIMYSDVYCEHNILKSYKQFKKNNFDGQITVFSDKYKFLKRSNIKIKNKIVVKYSKKIIPNFKNTGIDIGMINETDVSLAKASNAIIIGFNIKPNREARKSAEQQKVRIEFFNIIYKAIEFIEKSLSGLLEPERKENIEGVAEILKIFKLSKSGKVAGSKVTEGEIKNKSKARIIRDGNVVYDGNISSIFREKNAVKDVKNGLECGISFKNFVDFKERDIIESYRVDVIERGIND